MEWLNNFKKYRTAPIPQVDINALNSVNAQSVL